MAAGKESFGVSIGAPADSHAMPFHRDPGLGAFVGHSRGGLHESPVLSRTRSYFSFRACFFLYCCSLWISCATTDPVFVCALFFTRSTPFQSSHVVHRCITTAVIDTDDCCQSR